MQIQQKQTATQQAVGHNSYKLSNTLVVGIRGEKLQTVL